VRCLRSRRLKSTELWELFYKENPLGTLEPTIDDLRGWNSETESFEMAIRETNPKIIIEVGSWKGKSAIHMAKLAPEAKILCIDTWLGSREMFGLEVGPDTEIERLHGWPQLYFTFASNVVRHVGRERICPIPLPSAIAALVLGKIGFEADLIYIDGSHEYEDVLRDIDDYWPLLKSGGVMLLDDFTFPMVGKAVRERFPDAVSVGEKALVRKS
jgi:predicted O-methyltransferase YrrM